VATNPKLRSDLLKKLGGVTPQRLSQLVAEVKRKHGPMNAEDAAYVLAHIRGMDLSRYLDRTTVDRIRGMVPRDQPAAAAAPAKAAAPLPRKPASKPVRVGTLPAVDLLLTAAVADDAARMADLYPRLYLLENSIRNVINRVMTAKHGADWWDTRVSKPTRDRVHGRKEKEDKAPWHGKRGTHDIYYSDFSDLKSIITRNWADFEDMFPNQGWITVKLEELEPARNTLAHHNPVPAKEQTRFEVIFDDWAKLIDAKRSTIP
jgi:hypothetical protein